MAMRRVVVVAMPCTEVVDVAGILDIFYAVNERTDRTGASDAGYAVEVVSPVATVSTWPGLRLVADRSYRVVRGSIDTLIVTGIDEPDDAKRDPELVRWLARMAPRTRRVAGLCTGALVLAEAGLLDGRRATTHWAFCDELARRFPGVEVQPDPIYVRDGGVYTSAGATAGLDLVLALVEEDLGRRLALTSPSGWSSSSSGPEGSHNSASSSPRRWPIVNRFATCRPGSSTIPPPISPWRRSRAGST